MLVWLGPFDIFCEVGFIFLPGQFLFAQVRDQCYTVTERRGYKELR